MHIKYRLNIKNENKKNCLIVIKASNITKCTRKFVLIVFILFGLPRRYLTYYLRYYFENPMNVLHHLKYEDAMYVYVRERLSMNISDIWGIFFQTVLVVPSNSHCLLF